MTYVILGAGPAGVVAAETLNKVDPAQDIMLIGDESEPPYSRMAIPYYLTGKIGEEGTYLRKSADHYSDRNIRVVRDRVTGIEISDRTVSLAAGGSQTFDKLLIATGSHPIKPAIQGLDLPGVHHCWTLEDSRNIVRLAEAGKPVVLIGAGFIGCIILESLLERGVDLTIVEAEERMVPRMLDASAGGLIKRWCEAKGVRVFTSTRVTKIERGAQGALKVTLDNGDTADAALVVVAAGVKANTDFLGDSGIKAKDGIVVDRHLQTSVEGIYAAGDCAEGPDFSTGGWSVHAIQPTAADHGRIAAFNMAGRPARFNGSLSMNVLDTAGLISCSFGAWDGMEGGESCHVVDETGYKYMRLEFLDDVVVGALSLGRTDHIGVLRGLIQSRVRLGNWKTKLIANPHRIAEAYIACTQ